jgi:hypothetical protein
MKLRYLKTYRKVKQIETCESLPKMLQWMRILPFFRDNEVTYVRLMYKLQYLENGKWIDVPIIEVIENETSI